MSGFRRVTDDFWVSPQISTDDVAAAKAQGFTVIVNNRPDGESADQPAGRDIEAAARAAGLDYLYAPVAGRPTAEAVVGLAGAADGRKTLAFCRSGTRSIVTWALGQASRRSREETVRLAAEAGYDISAML